MGDLRFNGEKYEVRLVSLTERQSHTELLRELSIERSLLMRFRNSISLYRKNSMKREK